MAALRYALIDLADSFVAYASFAAAEDADLVGTVGFLQAKFPGVWE